MHSCEQPDCPLHSGSKAILSMKSLVEASFVCALKNSGGSVQRAAKMIGIGRATAYRMKAEHERRQAELLPEEET